MIKLTGHRLGIIKFTGCACRKDVSIAGFGFKLQCWNCFDFHYNHLLDKKTTSQETTC